MEKIILRHNGFQCPWLIGTQEHLKAFCKRKGYFFKSLDVSRDENHFDLLCGFPFAVFMNDMLMTSTPIFPSNIADVFERKYINTVMTETVLQDNTIDDVVVLDENTMNRSIRICQNGNPECHLKTNWYKQHKKNLLGFVGLKHDESVVLLEMELITIHDISTARIMCFYNTHKDGDVKRDFFQQCLPFMKKHGIVNIEVIVGKHSFYPNGTKYQFEQMGFLDIEEIGKTYILNRGYDLLYKMKKTLVSKQTSTQANK